MDDSLWSDENLGGSLTAITAINDCCRICLSQINLIPVFGVEGSALQLLEKIQKYLPVKIFKTDSFSHQVCFECKCTLVAWDTLYSVCLNTNKKLLTFCKENSQPEFEIKLNKADEEVLMPIKKRKLLEEKKEKINKSLNIKLSAKRLNNKCNDDIKRKISKKYKNLKTAIGDSSEAEIECVDQENKDNNFLFSTLKKDNNENIDEADDKRKTVLLKTLKCELCDDVFTDDVRLLKHRKEMHNVSENSEMLRCNLCNSMYKTKANLDRHHLKKHLVDQVDCPICHESFNSKKLNLHLKSSHKVQPEVEREKSFECQLCDKRFKNKYVRNAHEKEVHLSEPVQCKLCDFKGTRTVLKRHQRYVHVEKRFVCSLCPGAFKTLHTLKLHMTSHSDVRCYTCDVCGMGFKRLNNVRDHMKCHEQKSNQCQICGNFFARKRYLAVHEKTIHNFYADGVVPDEKDFECEICGAKLKWKKNLLAHMRTHTGEKPYACKICNKNFKCHGSLRTHAAKHCGANEERTPRSQVVWTPT